jgi:hypothetical protein
MDRRQRTAKDELTVTIWGMVVVFVAFCSIVIWAFGTENARVAHNVAHNMPPIDSNLLPPITQPTPSPH